MLLIEIFGLPRTLDDPLRNFVAELRNELYRTPNMEVQENDVIVRVPFDQFPPESTPSNLFVRISGSEWNAPGKHIPTYTASEQIKSIVSRKLRTFLNENQVCWETIEVHFEALAQDNVLRRQTEEATEVE